MRRAKKRRGRGSAVDWAEIGRKARAAGENVLELAARDPEEFLARAERFGVGLADGVEKMYHLYQQDPGKARRVVRNFAVQQLAKMGKKKLEEGR